jgi:peptidyl-prolyl cis-trans isomerase C
MHALSAPTTDDATAVANHEDPQREQRLTELLRREAQRQGLLAEDDPPVDAHGVITQAAMRAIEALIDQQVQAPEPDDAACRRHHAAHTARYSLGERVQARHILFAVTEGVPLNALRQRAEQTLLDVRAEPQRFGEQARALSNCPTGELGGELGWLTREDCADEFARELFAHTEVGVLPRLVHSRYGLHVVEVQARQPGELQPYEQVKGAVALALKQQSYVTALRQYLQRLEVQGEAGDDTAAVNPLLQ